MVEASLTIALFSIIFGSSVVFMLKMREMYQQIITDRNMWVVISSTAGFVRRNGRLPYPSNGDGDEMEYPEDDREWRINWSKYNRGKVPWRALGIPEIYSRDGQGKFYTYIVDPTLCGRKKVESVAMGDLREAIDFEKNSLGHFVAIGEEFEEVVGNSDQLPDSIHLSEKQYSSYRAVRSYLDDCGYDTGTKTKCWDIASKLKDCKLLIYKNGQKLDGGDRHFMIRKRKKSLKEQKLEENAEGTFASLESKTRPFFGDFFSDADKDSPYRVDDFVAFVLISHKNRFNKDKNKKDKKENINKKLDRNMSKNETNLKDGAGDESQETKDPPNMIHLDKNPGDLIIFMYRFQFMDLVGGFGNRLSTEMDLTKMEQKCCGFEVVDM